MNEQRDQVAYNESEWMELVRYWLDIGRIEDSYRLAPGYV